MVNRRFMALTALIFFGAVSSGRAQGDPRPRPFVGIMGVQPEDMDFLSQWGLSTVELHNSRATLEELQSYLDLAKAHHFSVFVKGPSFQRLQTQEYHVDVSKVEAETRRWFGTGRIAGDPAFLGYYVVDEPCHAGKWELTASDMKKLYQAVKKGSPQVSVIVNFGTLECLQQFTSTAQKGWKLTDVALFTVTPHKMDRYPDYIDRQAKLAAEIKSFDPSIKIVPQVAVLEFVDHHAPFPPAEWVERSGMDILSHKSFDGLMYYSFQSLAPWMGETITDVKDDPKYVGSFKKVFAAANR